VTQALQAKLDAGKVYDEVIAIGPLPMMKAVCDLTKPKDIKTIVSMNPIMIDGTGMCGGCRVTVGGVTKFACVDGPDLMGISGLAEAISAAACSPGRAAGDGKAPQVPPDGRCSIMPNMSLQKHPMPEQQPDIRATNFKEVALGYTREIAMEEADPAALPGGTCGCGKSLPPSPPDAHQSPGRPRTRISHAANRHAAAAAHAVPSIIIGFMDTMVLMSLGLVRSHTASIYSPRPGRTSVRLLRSVTVPLPTPVHDYVRRSVLRTAVRRRNLTDRTVRSGPVPYRSVGTYR